MLVYLAALCGATYCTGMSLRKDVLGNL